MAFRQVLMACLTLLILVSGRPPQAEEIATNYEILPLPTEVYPVSRADIDEFRLPPIVTVSSYDIIIKPDFYNNGEVVTFSGEIIIRGYFIDNVKRVTLHAGNNIRIFNVRIDYVTGGGVPILSTERDEDHEFLHLITDGNLMYKDIHITIGYTATFSGDMDGFYKTYYKAGGHDRLLLLTQFEPTMARKAFPCFDEPAYKATFRLTIYAPQGYGALSNTPLDREASSWGTTETTKFVFQPTAKMSTYSFAFMLYQQDSYAPTSYGAVTPTATSIFSWSLKSDIDAGRADYSLSVSARALGLLETYTDFAFRNFQYNMSKVDQVVVPNLRLQGRANWGLISYRADRLLVDPQEATETDKELAEEYIANELAHQWFGNLVTPEWWDYTWLSEGLDTYFQYWVVQQLRPDWRALERFVVEQQQSALLADAKPNALPLNGHVSTPAEIAGKFSSLTQSKGASIINMLSNIMGEGTLRDALRSFVSSKKYASAVASDLGKILEEVKPSNISVNLEKFLNSWTDNAGYPLVTVTRDYERRTVTVKQMQLDNIQPSTIYYVPLLLKDKISIYFKFLEPNENLDPINIYSSSDEVLLLSSGYYRVNYDEINWQILLTELKEEVGSTDPFIPPRDRAQLVDDSLNLARAGIRGYKYAIETVEYLSVETDIVPWTAALPGLKFLQRMLVNLDEDGDFPNFMQHILSAAYAKLGVSNTGSHLDKLLRGQILHAACTAGDQNCLDFATAHFRSFLDDGRRPDPDLRDVILCYGIQNGAEQDWAKLSKILETSEVESERAAIISALGCSKETDILKEYLDDSLTNVYLRDNERPSVFAAIYANPDGVRVAYEKLFEDSKNLLSVYGEKALANAITNIAEYLLDEQQAVKLKQLINDIPIMKEVLEEAAALVYDNAAWVVTLGQDALDALKAAVPSE